MEEIQKQYCIEVLLSLSNATNTVGEKTHTHTHREWPRWGERCGGAPSSSPSRATTKISCFIPQKPTVHRKISSRRSRIIREQKWEKPRTRTFRGSVWTVLLQYLSWEWPIPFPISKLTADNPVEGYPESYVDPFESNYIINTGAGGRHQTITKKKE